MLLKLFDDILANEARATGIKAAITKIEKKEIIFEDKKEDKPVDNIID